MALFVQDLRCEIFRSSTDRESVAFGDIHFGESKVSQPQIANLIDENVFRFETLYEKKVTLCRWCPYRASIPGLGWFVRHKILFYRLLKKSTFLLRVCVFLREGRRVNRRDSIQGRRKVSFSFGKSSIAWRWKDGPYPPECFVQSLREFTVYAFRCIFSWGFSSRKPCLYSILYVLREPLWHRSLSR